MNPTMWISKTGVQAQDAKLQAIANNLANVNTVGFKRDRVVFEDLFYSVEQQPGAEIDNNRTSVSGVQLGNGARIDPEHKSCSPPAACRPPTSHWTWPFWATVFCRWKGPMASPPIRAGHLRSRRRPPGQCPEGLPPKCRSVMPQASPSMAWSRRPFQGNTRALPTPTSSLTNFLNPTGLLCWATTCTRKLPPAAPDEGEPGTDGRGKISRGAGRLQRCKWSRKWST